MKKTIRAFLIKKHLYILNQTQNNKTFSNYQATYQKKLCFLFEKNGQFFSQSERKDRPDPPPADFHDKLEQNSLMSKGTQNVSLV